MKHLLCLFLIFIFSLGYSQKNLSTKGSSKNTSKNSSNTKSQVTPKKTTVSNSKQPVIKKSSVTNNKSKSITSNKSTLNTNNKKVNNSKKTNITVKNSQNTKSNNKPSKQNINKNNQTLNKTVKNTSTKAINNKSKTSDSKSIAKSSNTKSLNTTKEPLKNSIKKIVSNDSKVVSTKKAQPNSKKIVSNSKTNQKSKSTNTTKHTGFSNTVALGKMKSTKKVEPTNASLVYENHLKAGKSHKINYIENETQLNKYVKSGKLVKVPTKLKGYYLEKLDYSKPYLTPKAKEILRDISYTFYKKNNQNKFAVTSLTRTENQQKNLRKVNGNASVGESSHSFGSSFDISYVRFNEKVGVNSKLERELEEVLKSFESTGKIYYIKEKKLRCFHITVRNY